MLCSGEALQPWVAEKFHATFSIPLDNLHGPTETTTCTFWRCPPGAATVPIGVALGALEVYVLNEAFRLPPDGVPGEIYVSGPGLARGYLGAAVRTAERFVACPFRPGRMYRTGDLARRDPDGNLEFLGRADDQVEIRGFQVEPAEVESRYADHPDVARVAVVARSGGARGQELVAYVVPVDGARWDAAALCDFGAQALPDYMVPAAVVRMESLPVNAHGKLDRQALPAPPAPAGRPDRRSRDDREAALCAAFAEVLDVDGIGVEDDFFDLGGHSLLVGPDPQSLLDGRMRI
ncbi:non-ribosomal peptide synthetase [Actinomadura monticuli]|uniref:Non-ribosomal peptide synthetase n=1 Tax=Actinomadura monticuli TaxID=3097367 RepID=A0ABV4QLD5_9ACTN